MTNDKFCLYIWRHLFHYPDCMSSGLACQGVWGIFLRFFWGLNFGFGARTSSAQIDISRFWRYIYLAVLLRAIILGKFWVKIMFSRVTASSRFLIPETGFLQRGAWNKARETMPEPRFLKCCATTK